MLSYVTPIASNLLLWIWLLVALFLWRVTRNRRRARRWSVFLLAALWLVACRPFAELFVLPLESRYHRPSIERLAERGVRQVVVLTGGGYPAGDELLSSAFPTASGQRFLGGLELCARLDPDCRLIFSGSAGRGHRAITTAETMRALSRLLDPRRPSVAEVLSGSTAEHPENVRPLLAEGPFALVTSASHMPRAMRSFRRAGLEPIAYPVAPLIHGHFTWNSWIPSLDSLGAIQVAWREYLGMAFYALRGW